MVTRSDCEPWENIISPNLEHQSLSILHTPPAAIEGRDTVAPTLALETPHSTRDTTPTILTHDDDAELPCPVSFSLSIHPRFPHLPFQLLLPTCPLKMTFVFIVTLLFLTLSTPSSSLQIALGFGERKCFSEEVPTDRSLLVDFHSAAGTASMDLDLFVTNTEGQVVLHKSRLSHIRATLEPAGLIHHKDHAARHAPSLTTYRFCLMHQTMPSQIMERAERKVDFEIRPAAAERDVSQILSGGQMDTAHESLRQLESEITMLVEVMDAMREQEQVLTSANESTSRFLTTVSSLTSLFVLSVGMLQLEVVQAVLKYRKFIR